ncbi:MAG: Methylamine utilization protein MauE [Smithella sp. PtaU1.Bin162]|nr:MAG: Methylamine utilization protein MauE [Smithella sp. PtaU1.Bin162]
MKLRNFPGPVTPAVALVCRLTVAAVFLYAGCEKIIAPQEFATAIYNYRLLPDWAINVLAVTLPYLEVLLAVCLLVSIYVRGASFIAALLFLVFAIALTINLVRGLDISCGCFGGLTGSISWFYLVRDVALMAISVFALFFDRGWSYFFTR